MNPATTKGMSDTTTETTLPGLVIRPAREADAALLCSLIRDLAAYEHLSHACHIDEASVLRHLLGPERCAEALIASVGEDAAGFAVFYKTFSTFAAKPGLYLEDLYVRPLFRRQGIGTALLKCVGRLAAERNCGRYEWTTLQWNANARMLYSKLGATEMKEWLLLRIEGASLARFAVDGPVLCSHAHCGDPGGESCRCSKGGSHHG